MWRQGQTNREESCAKKEKEMNKTGYNLPGFFIMSINILHFASY
jgi:hypothetical protein